MWDNLLLINSILWACTAIYFIYSIGYAILRADAQQFFIGLGLFLLSLTIEIILGGLKKY